MVVGDYRVGQWWQGAMAVLFPQVLGLAMEDKPSDLSYTLLGGSWLTINIIFYFSDLLLVLHIEYM